MLELEEEERTKTDANIDKMVHGAGNEAFSKSLHDRKAPSKIRNLKMQQTLNVDTTRENVGDQVTELEELCDFTEVEIGEFDES